MIYFQPMQSFKAAIKEESRWLCFLTGILPYMLGIAQLFFFWYSQSGSTQVKRALLGGGSGEH